MSDEDALRELAGGMAAMRMIVAYLPTMIGLTIAALYGFYWARREREEARRQRQDR